MAQPPRRAPRTLFEASCTECTWTCTTERDDVERAQVGRHRTNTGHVVRRSREENR